MKELFVGPSIIYYLVSRLKEKYPHKQIGKTIIQKLMYLLEINTNEDYDYTMYHYGPYSSEVGEYINQGEILGMLNIDWIPNQGYFITPLEKDNLEFYVEIDSDKKRKIDELVDKFGNYSANELSIIATALYVKNNFNVKNDEELVNAVLSVKPKYKKEWIRELLKKAEIIG